MGRPRSARRARRWAPGAPKGFACAAISCVPTCATDGDCEAGYACEQLKDQYGASGSARGCIFNPSGGCGDICGVLASSVDDATLAAFVACMQDGQAACSAIQQCLGGLM